MTRFTGTWLWVESQGVVATSTPEVKGAARTLILNPDLTYEFHHRQGTRDSILCKGIFSVGESSEIGGGYTTYSLDFDSWYEPYEKHMSVTFEGPDTLDLIGVPCASCPEHTFVRGRTALFSAEVIRGQPYRRELWDGLRFELRPRELGWEMAVLDSVRPKENLAQIRTSTADGPDPRLLEGWHFRSVAPGAGKRDPGKGDWGAWLKTRVFQFSRDPARGLPPPSPAAAKAPAAGGAEDAIEDEDEVDPPPGRGVLTVESVKLGPAAEGAREGIETMRFTVAIEEALSREVPGTKGARP